MLAGMLTTKSLLRRVVPKDVARAATAEATLRDVHLQTLVLQKRKSLFYAGTFPTVFALEETIALTRILPIQSQVQAQLPQLPWSQQSLQI